MALAGTSANTNKYFMFKYSEQTDGTKKIITTSQHRGAGSFVHTSYASFLVQFFRAINWTFVFGVNSIVLDLKSRNILNRS